MSLASVLRGVATVGGAAIGGYGQDQSLKVKQLLEQAKLDQEAQRNAVMNRVALAGIDPDLQGRIAGSRAAATVQPDVDKAKLLSPIHTEEAVNTATKLSPIKVDEAVDTATRTAPITQANQAAGAEASAAAAERHAPPIAVSNKDGSQTLVTRQDAIGQQKAASGAGGMGGVRGLGPGGVFGAGSGLGSVKEMQAANPNLKKFEEGFLNNTSDLTALDRFRSKLASDLATHGFISAATASEAERELAAHNPDLAVYGRNLKQWVVSDMNLSRGGTDERARMDQAVSGLSVPLSSMPLDQRQTFLNQMWEARDARLDGLVQSATAAKAILDRVSAGAGGGPSPSHGGGDNAAQVSPLRAQYDAAVAHLKAQHKTAADILKTLGDPP